MRIAFVSEHASPLAVLGGADAGGQNVHVAALSEALTRMGHEVRVYTRRDNPALPHQTSFASGVIVEHVDAGPPEAIEKDRLAPFMPDFGDRLVESWKHWRPDVAHAHFWMSGLAALHARKYVDVPLVQTFHALGSEKKRHQGLADTSPPSRLHDEAHVAGEVDWIVATSTAEAFELSRMGASPNRVSVIPCGVDLAHLTPHGPADERTDSVRRVVAIGRLVERKGVDDVIRALASIRRVELIVAGGPDASRLCDDPEVRRLRYIAREAGAQRVRFTGRVGRPAVPSLLRSADIVACYPWYEPFGIVPLEAMACGAPVVAAAVGGLVDTVLDGITGDLVPPRRPDLLAQTISALLDDRQRRSRYGAEGRRRVVERYGWQRIAHDTLGVYERSFADRVARAS